MKRALTSITVCVIALGFSLPCHADIIYSNLGPGDTYPDGPIVAGSAAGSTLGAPGGNNGYQLLPSGGNFVVTSFTVGVDFDPPSDGFSPLFDAYLYSNVLAGNFNNSIILNEPGTEIAEIGQALQAPSAPGLVTFSPLSAISLTASSLYWVVLTPDNPQTLVVWDNNSLEVNGTLLTPEPATFGLLACALAGFTAIRRKHHRIGR